MADLTDEQILAATTAAVMEKVNKLLNEMIPRFTPGTVESFSSEAAVAQVKVDGDPDDQITPMSDLTGAQLVPGQRVMVIFVPPHGAFVLGIITNPTAARVVPAGWSALNTIITRTIDAGTASPTTNRNVTATLILDLIAAGIIAP